ncbi:MAG: 2-succinyl-5-enolpyruvyl-6-hydroxy-3-cyclohexene-1-carboxylic-acid synthase [Sulfuricella sp.]|nr:2-succinyl-5-enolpyruvyl-6-hydroxy-3-cyclohexene-1-carboxylic-acid synthase [Sulfuricella sp.]
MDDLAATNQLWALTLINAFVAAGVRHAVISPGSRSTPLALACERHPGIVVHVVLDERSAAFFALGLAKAEGRPALVIATSGSAPANWFPAVIEAAAGAQPLILLSADRPPELRECGANQTVDQLKLFGGHVRFSYEFAVPEADPALLRQVSMLGRQAVARSRWPLSGPVHLNLPFREPLVAALPTDFEFSRTTELPPLPLLTPAQADVAAVAAALSGQPGLMVCGGADYPADFAERVTALAARLDCPLLADPLSGLRYGGHERSRILTRYDAFLRNPDFADARRPAWILRFGAMPVSKPVQQYLAAQESAQHLLVDPSGRWSDPLHRTTRLIHADPATFCAALAAHPLQPAPPQWAVAFAAAERRAATAAEKQAPPEAQILRCLLDALPSGALLFSGNSMPIRDIDGFSGSAAKPLRILANRGASGIDGNLATVLGLSAAGQGKTVALLGDLALCHDAGALLAARGRDITLVVMNNGGGGIFGYLPQAGLAEYQKLWLTPQQVDFAALAQAYGVGYACADSVGAFETAFRAALMTGGANLIEVQIDLPASIAGHRAYWKSVAD